MQQQKKPQHNSNSLYVVTNVTVVCSGEGTIVSSYYFHLSFSFVYKALMSRALLS